METKMHSSRMCTGRLLTVCRSLLPGEGGVCSGGCLLLGAVCSGAVFALGGVCSQGGGIPARTEAGTPPLTESQTRVKT